MRIFDKEISRRAENSYTVCILGGTGFLGRHLLNVLLKETGVHIKVLSRYKSKLEYFSNNVQVVKGDLLDLDSLVSFLEPGAVVINLVYLKNQSMEDNLKAIENLANACIKVGVVKLVHCSTTAVFGCVDDNTIVEETVCNPVTMYEKTKLEAENLLLRTLKDKCIVIIVRPSEVFGEGGRNLLKLAKSLTSESNLIRSLKISLFSKQRLNLVYVENVVTAIWYLARFNFDISGQIFVISDDDAPENNYYDVIGILSEHLGIRPVGFISLPFQSQILQLLLYLTGRNNTNPKQTYSIGKLIQTGFKKPVSFQDGIKLFATWFKNQESGRGVE